MNMHYRKPVIVLINEYDVQLTLVNAGGYYKERLDNTYTIIKNRF